MRHSHGARRALALLAAAIAITCPARATCTRKESALTSSCDNQCFPGRPCIAFSADANPNGSNCTDSALNMCTSSSSSGCGFSCLRYGLDDFVDRGLLEYSSFTFLIPFGSFKSSWEQQWNASKKQAAASVLVVDETSKFPSASNDVVKNIEPLFFENATTTLTIAGGNSTLGVRGKVVDIDLSPGVLVSQTQLKAVTFANMGLGQIPASSFPPQLENFTLANCLLKSFPEDLTAMTSLQRLDLSKNYFAEYPVKYSLDTLRVLNASHNSLTSFDGDFPQLEILDLSDNVLKDIPASVYRMSRLTALYLQKNSFVNVQLTLEQFQFLAQIRSIQVDSFGATPCDANRVSQLGGAPVCVQTTNGGGGSGSILAVVLGSIGGGFVLVLLLSLWYFYRRRRNARNPKQDGSAYRSTQSVMSAAPEGTSLWNDQEMLSLQLNIDDIEDVQKIGTGALSVVYLVKYRETRLAASKRLKRDEVTWHNTQRFIAEIKLVAHLDHPRVVDFIGVAWTIEADLQALFEYMERGDMRDYLESQETPRCWTAEKTQIAIDVVESLVYVHSFIPPLLHRDLKSRNVLLDNQLRAKLSDFGVARYRSDAATMTTGIGTGRWLAPEVISGRRDYDQACDIWSFGVVLSEMDTHVLPYNDVQGRLGNQLADVAVLQMVAAGSLAPSFSAQCPAPILQIARRCLSQDPSNRPTAIELAYELRTLQTSAAVISTQA